MVEKDLLASNSTSIPALPKHVSHSTIRAIPTASSIQSVFKSSLKRESTLVPSLRRWIVVKSQAPTQKIIEPYIATNALRFKRNAVRSSLDPKRLMYGTRARDIGICTHWLEPSSPKVSAFMLAQVVLEAGVISTLTAELDGKDVTAGDEGSINDARFQLDGRMALDDCELCGPRPIASESLKKANTTKRRRRQHSSESNY